MDNFQSFFLQISQMSYVSNFSDRLLLLPACRIFLRLKIIVFCMFFVECKPNAIIFSLEITFIKGHFCTFSLSISFVKKISVFFVFCLALFNYSTDLPTLCFEFCRFSRFLYKKREEKIIIWNKFFLIVTVTKSPFWTKQKRLFERRKHDATG